MKALNLWGVAIALLLGSTSTVIASKDATPLAAAGMASVLRHEAAPSQLPPTADILRGPYEWSAQAHTVEYAIADVLRNPYEWSAELPATADVLRGGYEEIAPGDPGVLVSSGQN